MFNIFANKDKIEISATPSHIEDKKRIRHKGSSLLSLPNNYIVLDLETTGYNPRFDEIIEVACIRYSGSEKIDTLLNFVTPEMNTNRRYLSSSFRILKKLFSRS